jgi:hypothetical protein
MTEVILFSEDTLIEQAALRIIATQNPNLRVSNVMGKRGFAYFQARIREIRRSAVVLKFLVFLDGDALGETCPIDAIEGWFGEPQPNNIYIRFAFHEVESWLLADRGNLAAFLSVPENVVPAVRDDTQNTKELLLQIARRSRNREMVHDLVPQQGFTSVVGPAYNLRLSEFIQRQWDVRSAAAGNDSLARACRRVAAIR